MKIAIIGTRGYPFVYSGYETFVKELSERLVFRGFSVTIYCHKNLFKKYPKEVNGIKLVYISTIEKKSLSQFIHSFQSFFHAVFFRKHDVILVVNSANGPFGVLTKIFRKKTAINVDGLEWKRPKWKGLGAKYFHFASKLATKLFDVIITDSSEMQKIYKTEFNAESKVIAYGANIRYSKKPELINKWGIIKNNYYLIVGRLIPDNNGLLIVNEFLNSDSKKKLVIVGDVPYSDEYANNVKEINNERLIFTGYITNQNELAELYHNSFVYFHGHEYGGTNPALLQALANGCAVCALDTVFNREMLADGEYGVFFNKELNNLAEKIEMFENEDILVNEYKIKSRERIKKNYLWEKITNQYIELFNNLLNNNG